MGADVTEQIRVHRIDSRNILRDVSSNLLRHGPNTILRVRSRTLKDIFADNLSTLMQASKGREPDLSSGEKVAELARWPRGKKAGKPISPRQVLNAKRRGNASSESCPTLDFVQAMAQVFKVEPWELITEPGETRRRLIERLMRGPTVDNARMDRSVWGNPDEDAEPPKGDAEPPKGKRK